MAKFFEIRLKTAQGFETIKLQAESPDEARLMAPTKGRVISIKPTMGPIFGKSFSRSDRITLLRRLAMMTKSRVSLTKALDIISKSFTGKISEVAKELENKIHAGDELTDALASMQDSFPPTTISLIRAGMHGGELSKALHDASEFEYEMYHIGKGARSGMMSAAFEFLVAAALIIVTAYWVGPWVLDSQMMKMAGDEVNIDWAFVLAHILAGMIAVVLAVVSGLLLIAYVFRPIAPNFADNVVLKIPVFRELVLSKSYYSIFYGLSLLISSGVRIKDSLELAAYSAPEGAVKTDIRNAIKALDEGQVWATKMVNLHPTDRACLETAQDRTEIAEAFRSVAVSHRINYARRVEQVVPTISIISNLFMAMAGFLIFAMMMLPNLQLTRGIL